jgi:hypothetical protein
MNPAIRVYNQKAIEAESQAMPATASHRLLSLRCVSPPPLERTALQGAGMRFESANGNSGFVFSIGPAVNLAELDDAMRKFAQQPWDLDCNPQEKLTSQSQS